MFVTKVAIAEKPEFGLTEWGRDKIKLKKVEGGFEGAMRVTANTEMGSQVAYTRALSAWVRSVGVEGEPDAVVRFELEIRDKTGFGVDKVVRRKEFDGGWPYCEEFKTGREFYSLVQGSSRSAGFEAEGSRLLKNLVVRQHLEKELRKLNLPKHAE
jgi:hypothetical protein